MDLGNLTEGCFGGLCHVEIWPQKIGLPGILPMEILADLGTHRP